MNTTESKDKKYKILFVCLGNICRSPAAEGVMKDLVQKQGVADYFYIDSAGTGDYHIGDLPDPRMRAAAKQRGLILTHHCRQITRRDFSDFDMIIGMDASNMRNLRALASGTGQEHKLHIIGEWLPTDCGYDYVPDPYYGDQSDFILTLDLLELACRNLLAQHA